VGLLLAGLGAAALAASTVHLIRSSRRFVAVHRALGFTRSQVVTAYGVHGLISGAIGAALGLIAGVIAGHAVARSLVTSVGASPVLMVPALAWISAAAGALTAFVAAVVGAGAGLRDRPCEALRVE
jgi:ABC-type antimicrobial peptide transport system permease subunit